MFEVGTRVRMRSPHPHAGRLGEIKSKAFVNTQYRYSIELDRGGMAPGEKSKLYNVVVSQFEEVNRIPEKMPKPTVWLTTPEDEARIEAFMARSRIKRLSVQLAEARRRGFAKTLVPLDLLDTLIQSLNTKKNFEEAS